MKNVVTIALDNTQKCVFCKNSQRLKVCNRFKNMTLQDRYEFGKRRLDCAGRVSDGDTGVATGSTCCSVWFVKPCVQQCCMMIRSNQKVQMSRVEETKVALWGENNNNNVQETCSVVVPVLLHDEESRRELPCMHSLITSLMFAPYVPECQTK